MPRLFVWHFLNDAVSAPGSIGIDRAPTLKTGTGKVKGIAYDSVFTSSHHAFLYILPKPIARLYAY